MPLPPALLERLKKRKIIHDERNEESSAKSQRQSNVQSSSSNSYASAAIVESKRSTLAHTSGHEVNEPEEEIIAEDYDSDENDGATSDNEQADEQALSEIDEQQSSRLTDDNSSDDNDDDEAKRVNKLKKNDLDRGTTSEARDCSSLDERLTSSQQQQQQLNRKLDLSIEGNDANDIDQLSNETNPIKKSDLTDHESVIGCPNKYNIYHTCGQYCRDKYAQLKDEHMIPTKEQRKQLALLLKTFPISNEWTVVYDPGVQTFYFWNIITGHVSWVPPGMSAFASPSANQIREVYMEAERQQRQQQQDNSESSHLVRSTCE